MTEGAVLAGRSKPSPVKRDTGGTGVTAKSKEELAVQLEIPTLAGDNTFTGTNSFEGTTAVEGLDANGALNVYGSLAVTTDDPATFDKAPTVGGTALLTDATSDGNKYVRQNGAWVAIP